MELAPGIHQVDGVTSNVYLIVEPDGLTVIDSGFMGSGPKIVAYIQKIGRQPAEVRRILLTHQHVDHVGGAAALARVTGAAVLAHPLDAPAIAGNAAPLLPNNRLMAAVFRVFMLPRLDPVDVARTVEDGETLPVLEEEGGLRVVATPGHTPGQIAFYLPSRRLLFAGDAYAHRGEHVVPPVAMFTRDMAEARRSMATLARLEIAASLPGHGAPILRDAGARLAEAVKRG
ncbi:MAG TPA: MBL fold metallo-hydrolase [Ktedonobacterales bacterium]|nr:MBL fold metallo-hydrolase [Ktedonobacterales bacterium]